MQAQGPEAWLVIQGLPVSHGGTPEMLLDKTVRIMRVVGLVAGDIKETFRMGHSLNPSYIPIVKVRLSSRDLVQKAVKQAGRLKREGDGEYDRVFIRESRPQWARNLEHNIHVMSKAHNLPMERGRILNHPGD